MSRRPRDVESWLGDGLPSAVASRNYVPAPLHAKQRAFLTLPQLECLYGGAAGGGKTEALLADALQYIDQPSFSALILRRTFPALMLRGSIMQRALEWIGRDRWNERDKVFRFPSGATIQFGYCDCANDLERYKSAQFHRIYIDELTEWPEQWYSFLFSRIRRVKNDRVPLAMRAATNPDGLGAEWVRKRFGIPEGEIVREAIRATSSRCFLPATAEDNPALDLAAYEESLAQLGAIKYKQLRFGQWLRDGEGLVYGQFSSANILGLAPLITNKILCLDFGVTDAVSFTELGWADHSDIVVVLSSYKEYGLVPADAADRVIEKGVDNYFRIIGDTGGLGKAFAEEMRIRYHIPIEAAEKQNKRGYIDLLNGALNRKKLMIVMPECQQLKDEWDTLPWKEGRKEEADGFENHCADGALYGWRACTAFAEKPPPPVRTAAEIVEEARDRRREEARKGREAEGWGRWEQAQGGFQEGRRRR